MNTWIFYCYKSRVMQECEESSNLLEIEKQKENHKVTPGAFLFLLCNPTGESSNFLVEDLISLLRGRWIGLSAFAILVSFSNLAVSNKKVARSGAASGPNGMLIPKNTNAVSLYVILTKCLHRTKKQHNMKTLIEIKEDVAYKKQRSHRIEALADGVFAIAMTLLVLDIRVPLGEINTEQAIMA